MKKTRAVDIRTIRTKRAIANAVADCLLTIDRDKITIKIVAEKAEISRKTFYFYYKSVDEVLTAIQSEFVEKLCGIVEDYISEVDQYTPAKLFSKLNELFYEKADLYLKLSSFRDCNFEENILQLLKSSIIKSMEAKGTVGIETNTVLDFILSGILYVYSTWLKSDRQRPISELSDILGRFIMNGTNAFRR